MKLNLSRHGLGLLVAVPRLHVFGASVLASQMPAPQRTVFATMSGGFAVLMPVFYAGFGIASGVTGAALYTLPAKIDGGIEMQME
jgi:hypothetical protein